ncbi:MAG: hypothetical protein HY040_26415 [Planctomycetes bacterium]|nr:hypothetical protein [Planctomycetota bacterium]
MAYRIKTSQPRVAKIERAASDASLDEIIGVFAAAGGRIKVSENLNVPVSPPRGASPAGGV